MTRLRRRIVAVRNNGQNFEFDGTAWIQTSTNEPYLPRWDAVRQRMIGYNRNQSQMNLGFAEYNPTGTRRWTSITITGAGTAIGTSPSVRDRSRDRSLRGQRGVRRGGGGCSNDERSGSSSTCASAKYPGPIVYDPIRAGIVQFGGFRSDHCRRGVLQLSGVDRFSGTRGDDVADAAFARNRQGASTSRRFGTRPRNEL